MLKIVLLRIGTGLLLLACSAGCASRRVWWGESRGAPPVITLRESSVRPLGPPLALRSGGRVVVAAAPGLTIRPEFVRDLVDRTDNALAIYTPHTLSLDHRVELHLVDSMRAVRFRRAEPVHQHLNVQHAVVVIRRGGAPFEQQVACHFLGTEAHERVHRILDVRQPVAGAKHENASWFEDGFAEYFRIQLEPPECTDVKQETRHAIARFAEDGARRRMFGDSPSGAAADGPDFRLEGMTADQYTWDLYTASLGALLYYERKLGHDRFVAMVRSLSAGHWKTDAAFYAELVRLAEVDIRRVSAEEIRATLPEYFVPEPTTPAH